MYMYSIVTYAETKKQLIRLFMYVAFLAHLSRRLTADLIVWLASVVVVCRLVTL